MTATYTKLRDGSWGIRSNLKLTVGQNVPVTKRNGTSKTEQVTKVLWTDGKVWLASIGQQTRTSGQARRTFGRTCS